MVRNFLDSSFRDNDVFTGSAPCIAVQREAIAIIAAGGDLIPVTNRVNSVDYSSLLASVGPTEESSRHHAASVNLSDTRIKQTQTTARVGLAIQVRRVTVRSGERGH